MGGVSALIGETTLKQLLSAAIIALAPVSASAVTIFSDDFNLHDDVGIVGNGWTEHSQHNKDVQSIRGYLRLRDGSATDEVGVGAAQIAIDATGFQDIMVRFWWRGNSANTGQQFLNLSWSTELNPSITDGSAWTRAWQVSAGSKVTGTAEVGLGPLASNTQISLLLWTSSIDSDSQVYLVDNFEVLGTPVPSVQTVASMPIPGALPILGTGLAALGLARLCGRRKSRT